MTLDEFFQGHEKSRPLFEAMQRMINAIGSTDPRVTMSQIAFRQRKAFAWVWLPGKYLRGKQIPLVLTLALRSRDASPRWKAMVEPYPGRFTHHLEIYSIQDIDDEVCGWLQETWMEVA